MTKEKTITVAYGDGIGPEIMESVLYILRKAMACIKIESIEIGEKLYNHGWTSGISSDAWETVKHNKVLLKAPITTPLGHGYKSLNVTFRKGLALFANVRPVQSYYPYVKSMHSNMDVVIVRENEEDLYAGVEYQISPGASIAYKIVSKSASEKIIRYAFEYAKAHNRKKVTCITKNNIMKVTDGTFESIFQEIAKEYKEINSEHMIVDIAAARLAAKPENFDVIVTLNLYGDILSDIAAEISGSVGLAGSANIGAEFAMFEAVHGSAPDIAGKNIANPSGLLNAAILMLEHLENYDTATTIQNALLKTLEDGIHTADIYQEEKSIKKASTKEFTDAVTSNLGKKPKKIICNTVKNSQKINIPTSIKPKIVEQELVGVDLYLQCNTSELEKVISNIQEFKNKELLLHLVSSRGIIIWPNRATESIECDFFRFRFLKKVKAENPTQEDIIKLLQYLNDLGIHISGVQSLFSYDKKIGFSLAQGE